ncbi:aldehyde dehydrogenase [Natronococcus sp. JC468]|uniref:aldehyde dehydrogenase family protein n=1 Tax=Natronococcus sp. JC468 TaxID=1961921 RepID=UPI00143B6279|nr:aldehyde dehydrogenase family protein [Natronococcus sp. JC468]NKE36146.1 aldehyde dehydrogenase [Natronococcus sp. JC468]
MTGERSERYGAYVDGEFRAEDRGGNQKGGRPNEDGPLRVTDPATEKTIATVAAAGDAGVDDALEAARRAQPDWAGTDPAERGRVLYRFAEAIANRADDLADLVTRENGRPIGQSRVLVDGAADYLTYYAGATTKIEGETIPVPGDRQAFTRREPLGVSAQLIPWNAPLVLCCRGIAPALAAGNAVVVKPAPEAPLGLLGLAEIATEAGVPDGAFNVVPGGEATGAALVEDSRVDEITFTGSVETGRTIGRTAADNLVPSTLELGGNSPALVFADADLEDAVGGALQALTLVSGQACFATTRVFVHEDRYAAFREALREAVDALAIGPGLEDPNLGPLVSADARERVREYVDGALENGATALVGGDVLDREGYFYEPTVIEDVSDDAPIVREEVFGPVLTLHEFADEQEAIRRANDSEYGLYATVWTNDLGRGHRVANALEAGSVMINQYAGSYPQTPFGGYKRSGLGREKGMQALEHYTQLKTVNVEYGSPPDGSDPEE